MMSGWESWRMPLLKQVGFRRYLRNCLWPRKLTWKSEGRRIAFWLAYGVYLTGFAEFLVACSIAVSQGHHPAGPLVSDAILGTALGIVPFAFLSGWILYESAIPTWW